MGEVSFQELRQELAGFIAPVAASAEVSRPLAVRVVLLLARQYNSEVLDPLAKWGKIETAIRSGCENGEDAAAVLSSMLAHVQADSGRVASDPDFVTLINDLDGMGKEGFSGFIAYLRRSVFAAIAFGREQWKQMKGDEWKERMGRFTVEDEAAARECGEKPSHIFPEEEVQNVLKRRAAQRGEE